MTSDQTPDTDTDSTDLPPVPTSVAQNADVYAKRTVDELKTVIRDAEQQGRLDVSDLKAIYRHEAATKGRVTLTNWVADRLNSAGASAPNITVGPDADDASETDGDDPETETDPDTAPEPEPEPEPEPPGDDETAPPTGTTVVTVRAPGVGYYGGHWWDTGGDQNLDWDSRLEKAVRTGDLQLIAARDESVIPADLRP